MLRQLVMLEEKRGENCHAFVTVWAMCMSSVEHHADPETVATSLGAVGSYTVAETLPG